jgi:hypothetical protein
MRGQRLAEGGKRPDAPGKGYLATCRREQPGRLQPHHWRLTQLDTALIIAVEQFRCLFTRLA